MVTDIPFDGAQIDKAGALDRFVVSGIIGSHHIDMNVRTVRCLEVHEAENAAADFRNRG